ncbi:putative cytoplasmic protein [Escherichia coli M605]|uniref:Putative cytoplasmic protein n=1 Tax=Escherichia coli M605 TaxID=656417 RepID=F4SYF1_ECOLX|nr:putative cytoplasmic protein [Escherichia coli M605]
MHIRQLLPEAQQKSFRTLKKLKHGMDWSIQQVTAESGFHYHEDMMKAVCVVVDDKGLDPVRYL